MEVLGLVAIAGICLFAIIRYAVKYGVEDATIELENRKKSLKDLEEGKNQER